MPTRPGKKRDEEIHNPGGGPPGPAAAEWWRFPRAEPLLKRGKTLVMGIVNLDPLSFSGVNTASTPDAAIAQSLALLAEGADLIDLGPASSRPGAEETGAEVEIARLGDLVARLRACTAAPISVDTRHPETAELALSQGADIINDITALRGGWGRCGRHNPVMARIIANAGAHVILMHMPAAPAEMQRSPEYGDVVGEVREFLLDRAELAERAGIPRDKVWLDPGFGFGKTFQHNRELLLQLTAFADTGYQVAVGLSRKRMIADILGACPPEDRLEGSLALAVIASLMGADMVRVHDVRATARALAVADAIAGVPTFIASPPVKQTPSPRGFNCP